MNDRDIESIVKLLSCLEPGYLPYEIFEQVARIVALPIIEFIPLRYINNHIEVLLLRRPDNDRFWPGEWHTPGTIIRATDVGKSGEIWPPFNRIINEELDESIVSEPHFVGSIFHKSRRGAEHAQLFWVEIITANTGEFFPLSKLPHNFLMSQRSFVEQAAANYGDFIKNKANYA